MKVIHVLESMGAGVLTSVSLSCNILSQNGHDVYLIYSPLREETTENWRELFVSGVTLVRVDMCREVSPFKDFKSLLGLYRQIKEIKPDIVHLHSSKAGILGRMVSLFYGRKIKWFYSPRGLAYLNTQLSTIKRRLYKAFEYVAAKIATRVTLIGCSQSEYDELIKIRKNNVVLIENAIANIEKLEKSTSKKEVLRIGTLGRLSSQKNPPLFAAIAKAMLASSPQDLSLEFVWIGGGEPDYVEVLQGAAVKVTGWLDKQQALAELSQLDIYMQTSLYEGMPISVIEAMGMGIPVIVSNVIGNKDVVDHGANGFVCNSQGDFEKSIHALYDDDKRKQLGVRARELALQRFASHRLLTDLEKLYSQ